MKKQFISTECSSIQKIQFVAKGASENTDMRLTFVYEQEYYLLTLQFKNVTNFCCERDSFLCEKDTYSFNLGELLFYDDEDGTPLHIGDELGGFSLICDNVEFICLEKMKPGLINFVIELE